MVGIVGNRVGHLGVNIYTHHSTVGLTQVLRVGRVLQGEYADNPRLVLVVEIV